MSNNSSLPILNPNVYLNYLQPSVATQYEVTRNVFFVTFGALSWDVLSSFPGDWKIFQTTKPSPVLFAYFASRTCALAVVLMSALAKTGPVEYCGVMELILAIFWVFASGSSSYLFLKRVHAVFLKERLVHYAFTVLWVVGVGASMVMLPGLLHDYYEIANTKHCINVKIKSYVSAAFIVPVMFDVSVFFAISYKILKFHRTKKPTSWKGFCCGEALPHFSKAVLQGGQQYYMITVGVNVTRSIIALVPNVPPVLQLSPLVPAIALTCAMACRVFRNLKLEALEKTEVGTLPSMRFADRERAHLSVHLPKNADIRSAASGLQHVDLI